MFATILLRALPYLAALAAGAFGMHYLDGSHYNALRAKFEKYQADVVIANAASQKAYAEALQAQIDEKDRLDSNNRKVIDDLSKKTALADARHDSDAAFILRLLNGPSASPASGSSAMPAPGLKPGAPQASGASGIEQVAELCADTREEDQRNADRFDALLAELTPQLRKHP